MSFDRDLLKMAGLSGDALEAALVQQATIHAEDNQLRQGVEYSDQQIGVSVVHTRQDLVLLIGYTKLVAKRLRHIRFMAFIVMLCMLAVTYRFWEHEIAAALVRLGIRAAA